MTPQEQTFRKGQVVQSVTRIAEIMVSSQQLEISIEKSVVDLEAMLKA